tara:strand:+ start:107 stop:1048 length:942 start_codon:yes stop_codon:yes gene_type:complete
VIYNKLKKYKDVVDKELNSIYLDGPILLKDPINHIVKGGKRLRPILCMIAGEVCGGKLKNFVDVSVSIELLHIFSLVHDDIMDSDKIRHGKETIHCKWNNSIGILAGDAILALAFKKLNKSTNIIKEKFNSALIAVCEGQALDIEYESSDILELESYFKMIHLKTAYMMGLSSEVGAISAGVEVEVSNSFKKIGLLIGKAFQLQDDLLEVTSTSKKMGKTLNSDILLNKKTYIYLMLQKNFSNELNHIYKQYNNSSEKLNEKFRDLLNSSDIVNQSNEYIQKIYDEINNELLNLNLKNKLLNLYVDNIRNRTF